MGIHDHPFSEVLNLSLEALESNIIREYPDFTSPSAIQYPPERFLGFSTLYGVRFAFGLD